MPRLFQAAFAALVLGAAVPAWAEAPSPDASKIRIAGEQFQVGALAYRNGSFEEAASAFEAADDAVPGPKALKLAIRARDQAGQGSRAATLSAMAIARYPKDADLVDVATKTIEKLEPLLYKLNVSCASPCVLANGDHAIHGQADTRWIVYLDPGKATVSASFFGNAGGAQKGIDAKAGAASEVRFEPTEKAKSSPAPVVVVGPAPTLTPPGIEVPPEDTPPPKPEKGLPPAVFAVGAVVTAGLLGVTIWSGIDTKNNPGVDAVRAACAGKGEDCALFQEGKAHQMRTNVLLGATIGTAALTGIIGIAFTRWGKKTKADAPVATLVTPTAMIVDRGGGAGVALTY